VKRVYQIAETRDRKALTELLVREGQGLLPFVELIADARMAVDEFIDVLGRASLGAVLPATGPVRSGGQGCQPDRGRADGRDRR
jgi:hypothetical protein